jgi:hypothetical protein
MGLRIGAVIVDCHDPGRVARFWAEALDWVISHDEDPEWVVEPHPGTRDDCVVADLLFIKVPEQKTIKNRLHFDLRPEDQSAEVARLEALGATRADVGQGDDARWVVMADPEGNEFCVQPAHPPELRAQWLRAYESYQPVRT